ncbi:MAG TPA: ATP-binding cassette domain-containing protein [Pseudomonadales bacterium]
MTELLLQLQQQSLAYGRQTVLHDIHLTLQRGEKLALLGPSGAGKSSLLLLLYHQLQGRCALQPQGGALVDCLSAYQNMFIGGLDRVSTLAALCNLLYPLPAPRRELAALAAQLGLADKLWHSVDRLSGGQRQRVAIGRALFRRQAVYLGDEPVSSLDPLQAEALLTLLLQQHETAVVCLHQRQLALSLFDRVVVVCDGRIVCDSPTAALEPAALDRYYRQAPSPPADVAAPVDDSWVIRT